MHLSTFAQVRVDGDKDVIGVYPASDHLPIQRSQWMQQANLLRQLGLQLLSLLWCHSNPGRLEINGRCHHDDGANNLLTTRRAERVRHGAETESRRHLEPRGWG